jgi:hypothetical protein
MKIKLSRSNWEEMGKKAGWTNEYLGEDDSRSFDEIAQQHEIDQKLDTTLQSQLKILDILAQKIHHARHEIDTGVDPKYVFFQLKDEINVLLQRLNNDIEP